MRFIIFPTGWLCRWFPHKDEKVPDIVMRNIAGRSVPERVYMCERCGRFRVAGRTRETGADSTTVRDR